MPTPREPNPPQGIDCGSPAASDTGTPGAKEHPWPPAPAGPAASDFNMTASFETLKARSDVLHGIRDFFRQRGFLEVETPLLSQESVIDLYLDPIVVSGQDAANSRYLQTSPEFAMKRILSCGAPAIFQICKAFRQGDRGPRHNPEFTMLEWYRCGDDYMAGRQLLAEFCAQWFPSPAIEFRYEDLFSACVGLNPHTASNLVLREKARALGLHIGTDVADDVIGAEVERRDYLSFLWSEQVEPWLGTRELLEHWPDAARVATAWDSLLKQDLATHDAGVQVSSAPRLDPTNQPLTQETLPGVRGGDSVLPMIVYDFPAEESALALTRRERRADDIEVEIAERFELYVDRIELANGYHELLDAETLRCRNKRTASARDAAGKRPLPETTRLLAAMESGLPPCSGVALGVDRFLMVLCQASRIDDVLAFPWERA